jgi:GGDEF domain-containing protein
VNAQKVAAKIMDEVKNHFIQESIGLSVGVAAWEPGRTYLEVIDAADRDLYKSKQLLQR